MGFAWADARNRLIRMQLQAFYECVSFPALANPHDAAVFDNDIARMDTDVPQVGLDLEGSVCLDATGHVPGYPARHRKLAVCPCAYVLAMCRERLSVCHRTFLLAVPAAELQPGADDDAKMELIPSS